MSSDIVVNLSSAQQTISGFGASTAWASGFNNPADADTLWSTTTGAGLSLHRVHIDYTDGTTSELSIAQAAVAHGVTVWATPWTPPVADKSNDSDIEGTLTNGQAFATYLANFVTTMKGQGVPIYAISAQNEPDATVTYESCSYSGATLASFIGTYMGPALMGTGVKVIAPETQNWDGFATYEPALVSNTTAFSYTSIVATHEYGGNPTAYPNIAQAGKEFWETEWYDPAATADPGMVSALTVATEIHNALTVANMNAWHYWWVYSSGNGGLWDSTNLVWTKRLWIMGNFSRFVRPGYERVGTTGTGPSGVLLTAYTNAADGTVAIVAINNNASATSLSVFVSGAAPCSFTPWVTSATASLVSGTAVPVASSRFTVSLAAQSVTTFVGKP
jgi:glucuronoarabinoxylan endo-1,4-beta-xylanase